MNETPNDQAIQATYIGSTNIYAAYGRMTQKKWPCFKMMQQWYNFWSKATQSCL